MKQGFVLFGLRDKSGCTTAAIHIARYFAGGGYSVSLIESAMMKSPCLREYSKEDKIPYEKDGVTIYPAWDQEIPDSDIIIYDMGAISIAKALRMPKQGFEFILCANADEDTLFELGEALTEEAKQLNLLVFLKECGDLWVTKFKKINYRTFKIGFSRTTCPRVLADNLIQVCHFAGVLPPDINYDLEEWTSAIKTKPPKKSFLDGINKKKVPHEDKSENIQIVDMKPDLPLEEEGLRYDEEGLPIPEEMEYSRIKAHIRDKSLKKKPEKVFASQEEIDTEQGYKSAGDLDKPDSKDKIKNTLDSAADVSKTILNGISCINWKALPKKSLGKKESKETQAPKPNEAGVKDLIEKLTKPFIESEEDPGYFDIKIDKETVDLILSEERKEDTAVAEPNNIIKAKDTHSRLKFIGYLTVFVTALKHGAGSSHVAGIIGSALVGSNNKVCFIHKKGTEYPNKKNMCDYTDTEFGEPYNMAKTIIIDLGCLGELTGKELMEMQRSDIKVLVCGSSESDFQALARFIHKAGTAANKWIYVFNLVPGMKKRVLIKDLMQDYDYLFLQMCDYDEAPKDVLDMWSKQIKKKLK